MNFCKDCQYYQRQMRTETMVYKCSYNAKPNVITGQIVVDDMPTCYNMRTYDGCGVNGKFFQQKLSILQRLANLLWGINEKLS